MKSISPPDLTAYALNELPPDAATELTRLLAESPAEAATAEETRAFCELLSTTLAAPEAKDGGGLSAEQKQVITENLPSTNVVNKFRWPLWAGAGAAAAVAAWLAWPQALGKRSEMAAEGFKLKVCTAFNIDRDSTNIATTSEQGLPGGGGGLPATSTVASNSKTVPIAPYGDTLSRSTPPLPTEALHDRESAISRFKENTMEKNLGELSAAVAATEPPATSSPVGRPVVIDAMKADEAKAQSASGPTVAGYASGGRSLKPTSGPEVASAAPAPGKAMSDLYAHEESAPRGVKPLDLADGIPPAPKVATAKPLAAPSASIDGTAPATVSGGTTLGTLAQTQPMAKRKEALGLESDEQPRARLLDVNGFGTLTLESKPTRPQQAKEPEDRLYESVDEITTLTKRASGLQPAQPGSESYIAPPENPFKQVAVEPLSTFSIDVDTASYANVRRFLNMGQRPPGEAVRVEELVNYFRYAYPTPEAGKPCSLTADLVVCPWNEHHRLARVALKARVDETRPKANLVFLLDVSGSMNEPNKLPLVKQSLKLLVDKLSENDRVSIVVYAGASGVVLPPTHGENKKAILGAIDNLQPGGSTNGASGITLAYEMARKEFLKEGVNRVILATDGDFNVGISDRNGLQSLIEKEAKSGVFLSVLGYGMGNLKDSTMETLADKGNGNYAYIDSLGEARKVLSEEMSSTLVTVAKDVKIQIEFNPSKVRAYKLLGYENRMLAKEDFNDDKKDAGEMGAGHTVTALYEITPTDAPADVPPVDPLKYQPVAKAEDKPAARPDSPEIMTVKLRYKAPDGDVSQLMELPVMDKNAAVASAPGDFQFATAVAGYGLLLRGSKQVGTLNWEMIRTMAKAGKGEDAEGYRGEFLQLVDKAASAVPLP
jgi:secreted protein with Ig-like and vWFA domain